MISSVCRSKIRGPWLQSWRLARGSRTSALRCSSRYSTTVTDDTEERYIQTTTIPTLHFQPGLPRLPVPKLELTCQRYLAALRPMVDEERYKATEAIVTEFGKNGGEGEALNKMLVANDRSNKHTSYIAEPWFDMYLKSRSPLVLNYNPFVAFKDDPQGVRDQALRAANFIRSAVRFRAALWDKTLQPEVFHLNPAVSDNNFFKNAVRLVPGPLSWYAAALIWKAFPLDMSQYSMLFNNTRLPEIGKDSFLSFKDEAPRHLVVMRNGHYYSLDVVQENGLAVSTETVYSQLREILCDNAPPVQHQVGYLTGINRDKWAGLREELACSERNKETLRCIDSAMFVLCLDDSDPETPSDLSHTMLHNHGNNRWFDKSFSLIVTKGGRSSINFEHAWGDGVAVLRLFNELYKDANTGLTTCTAPPSVGGVTRLAFDLSDSMKNSIEAAKNEIESNTKRLSIRSLQYEKYGKNLLKKSKLSPDAILQLSIQIAYYRLYKSTVATYESCSTAAFKHGRTETIRSASMATKACSEAFERSHPAGPEEVMALIKTAADNHSKLVREAAMGQGFDRHMFALRDLAAREQLPPLPIFEDPSYQSLNHIILSTSTLSADAVLIGGFAPVTPDGYGIGYSVQDDWMGTQVSTYDTRDGEAFVNSVETVFNDLFDVFNGTNFK